MQARLVSNPRSVVMPLDLSRMGTEDEPPPKGAYWLLDRASPASGKEIKLEDISQVVGQVFIFGKQTDRAARLEMVVYRTQQAEAQKAVVEICGDALGAMTAEEVESRVPAAQLALTWNWKLPDDTSPDRRLQLTTERRREILANRWPETPQKLLGGKSPREAASDPTMRIRVLAALLLIELATEQLSSDFDFNELRRRLGLPDRGPIDPTQSSPAELRLVRLDRVEVGKLTDEQLIDLYRRADHFRHIAALRRLAQEILRRPGFDKKFDMAEAYGVLAQIEPDTERAIEHLDKARRRRGGQDIDRSLGPGRVDAAYQPGRRARGRSPLATHSRSAHSRARRGPGSVPDSDRGGHHWPRRQAGHACRARSRAGHRRARSRQCRNWQDLDSRQRSAQRRQEIGPLDAG